MKKRIAIIISWIAVLLWMLLIFRLSSQVAVKSNGLSLGITYWIQSFLANLISADTGVINHIVRKSAHFSAYLILGILSSNALRVSGIFKWKKFILALGICVLYAVSDEIHQLFIAGRSGQPSDVLIDSMGALIGIGIFTLIEYFHSKRSKVIKQNT